MSKPTQSKAKLEAYNATMELDRRAKKIAADQRISLVEAYKFAVGRK